MAFSKKVAEQRGREVLGAAAASQTRIAPQNCHDQLTVGVIKPLDHP